MARASKAITPKTTGTQVALVDDILSQEVALIKGQLGTPSGNKIKVLPSGDFVLPDGSNLGPEIQVVVVGWRSRNFFYSTPYNPNQIAPPDCYAVGSAGQQHSDLVPESDCPTVQHGDCRTCPLNQFKSGSNNKGKACSNRYWAAVLVVDPDAPDAHNQPEAPLLVLDISPSNLRTFEGAVNLARRMLKHELKAIFTVRGEAAGTYAKLSWHDAIPNPNYAEHAQRRDEAEAMLIRRPDFSALHSAPPPRQPARRQAGARR